MSSPSLSVVIAAWNGRATIGEQLDALSREQVPGGFEVVVADNGSTDDTADVVRSYADRLDVTVVDASARQGQTFARNTGVRASRAPYLVLLDQDDVIAPGYLATMLSGLQEHPLVGAMMSKELLNNEWVAKSRQLNQGVGLNYYNGVPWIYGCSMGIRRETFDLLGGFNESLDRAAEDVELCWRAAKLGITPTLLENAVLEYRFPTTLKGLFRQGRVYGRGSVAVDSLYRHEVAVSRSVYRWARSMVEALYLVVVGGDNGRRGAGAFLLGRRLGKLEGSIRHRFVDL
ncbi:MAG: glycosyltransferase [Acidimicrobiales bacterium]